MDSIIIKKAKFLCNIGITKKEQSKKQEILIDLRIFTNLKKGAKTDNIKDSVCYFSLYQKIQTEIENNSYNLIENLGEKIAILVLEDKKIQKVEITIKKPHVLSNEQVKYFGINIIRKQSL